MVANVLGKVLLHSSGLVNTLVMVQLVWVSLRCSNVKHASDDSSPIPRLQGEAERELRSYNTATVSDDVQETQPLTGFGSERVSRVNGSIASLVS